MKKYPNKKIYEIDEDKLEYNDKIDYIKTVYNYIIPDFRHIDDGKYVYENAGDILKFMLKLLRHLVILNENNEKEFSEIEDKEDPPEEGKYNKPYIKLNIHSEISKYMYYGIDISNEGKIGELKNIVIDKAEDDIGMGILTPQMKNIFKRIKGNTSETPRDIDFNDLGTFIQTKKYRETAMVLRNNLNDILLEFTKHFKVFMNTKSIRFSPICDKLNKTYFLIETAGQNDIQSLNIRVRQQLYIIDSILSDI